MLAKATTILILSAVCSLPALAAQRAFVASTGSDSNVTAGCTIAAPCRGFQAAHTAVDAGGEIVALDTAGYGMVTITKSVTIMGNPGVVAGIAVTNVNKGVTIATAGISVVLRGLSLNNVGDVTNEGVFMTAGNSLVIENCLISRFAIATRVETAATVKVTGSVMRGNDTGMYLRNGATAEVVASQFFGRGAAMLGWGIFVLGDTATTTSASVTDSVASDSFYGFAATASAASAIARLSCIRCTASNNVQHGFANGASSGGSARMMVAGSMASYNAIAGFQNVGAGAVFESLGNNALHDNGTPTSGSITIVAGN